MRNSTTYRVLSVTRRDTNRQKKTRRRRSMFVVALIPFLFLGYVAYSSFKISSYPYQAALLIEAPNSGQPIISWPEGGQAALGIKGRGMVAVSPNQHEAHIASLTKLVTALAVLEKKPIGLDEQGGVIEFTHNDTLIWESVVGQGGAAVPVTPGQTMTERQALEAMILPSANNIAITLAVWVFGSEENYVTYANQMLRDRGFTQTHIGSASGLDASSTSTPEELLKLAELAMNSPVLREIADMPMTYIPGYEPIENVNHISGMPGSVHGIKVGLTDEAGSCLIYRVEYRALDGSDVTFYGVVLGQEDFFAVRNYVNDVVVNIIPTNYTYLKVAEKGQPISSVTETSGTQHIYVASDAIHVPVWKGTDVAVRISEDDPTKLEVDTRALKVTYELEPHK